jgi:hypothetical protein
MEEIKVTWLHAIQIWWSITWRVVIFGGLAGLVLGLLFGIVGATSGADDDAIHLWGQIGGMLVSIPVGIWAVKTILGKEFPKYRIVLAPSLERRIEAQIYDQTPDQ